MTDPLLGTVALGAAFFAGVLALLAPCCITFLLPSYLAAGLQPGRWRLVRMTLVFAAGLAAVLLPVAWGVAGLGQLLPSLHRELFFAGGVLLLALAVLSFTGRGWSLPLPWAPNPRRRGAGAVFALGAFSGAASACCAPVLAGVLALSFVAPTWWLGVGVGLSYVFGMVFPLLLAAAFGERLNLLAHPALRPRLVTLPLGRWRARVLTTNLASALLLATMGALVLWLGATGATMYAPDFLQGLYFALRDLTDALVERAGAWAPLVVLGAAGLLALVARWPRPRIAGAAAAGDRTHPEAVASVLGSRERDPRCGMAVEVSDATLRSTYDGGTYFFCSPGCKASFEKDPVRYATEGVR